MLKIKKTITSNNRANKRLYNLKNRVNARVGCAEINAGDATLDLAGGTRVLVKYAEKYRFNVKYRIDLDTVTSVSTRF